MKIRLIRDSDNAVRLGNPIHSKVYYNIVACKYLRAVRTFHQIRLEQTGQRRMLIEIIEHFHGLNAKEPW